jgi:hypothetical protein
MNLTEIRDHIKKATADIKKLKQLELEAKMRPNRRLSKTEVLRVKTMLIAGETVAVISKKLEIVKTSVMYWQTELKIEDPTTTRMLDPNRPSMQYDTRLNAMRNRHDVTNNSYNLSKDGKIRHDSRKECPACFPDSKFKDNIDDYVTSVKIYNYKANGIGYAKKMNPVKVTKAMITADKARIDKAIKQEESNGVCIEDMPHVADRYVSHPPHTSLSHNKKLPNKIRKALGRSSDEALIEELKRRRLTLD